MLIDDRKIARVEVVDPEGNIVATISDRKADKAPGYKVQVYLDYDAIVAKNDVLHYYDTEDKPYLVVRADEKFFTMVPLNIDKETEEITLDYGHQRTYPNSKKVGELKDYGLALEYRMSEDEDASKKENGCPGPSN